MNFNNIILSSDTLIPTIFGYSFANELENGDRIFDSKYNHVIVEGLDNYTFSDAYLIELQNKSGFMNHIKVSDKNHFNSRDKGELSTEELKIGNILLGTNKSEWKVISKKKLLNEEFVVIKLNSNLPIVFDNNPYDLWKNWRGGVQYYKNTPVVI